MKHEDADQRRLEWTLLQERVRFQDVLFWLIKGRNFIGTLSFLLSVGGWAAAAP
jgi:hypothetical protein